DSAVLRSRAGEKECSRGNIVLAQIALSPSQCLGICQRKSKLVHDRVAVTRTSLTVRCETPVSMNKSREVSSHVVCILLLLGGEAINTHEIDVYGKKGASFAAVLSSSYLFPRSFPYESGIAV